MEENELERQRQEELNDSLLPWDAEQKVSCCLNPIKIPLIIIVGICGCFIENRLFVITTEQWRAHIYRDGPTCYVHRIRAGLQGGNTSFDLPIPDSISESVQSMFNHSVSTLCGGNSTDCTYAWQPVDIPKDHCDIKRVISVNSEGVANASRCTVGDEDGSQHTKFEGKEMTTGLIQRKVPYVYFTMLWTIYKLVFLPTFWPDRLVRLAMRLAGRDAHSLPVFKILVEPRPQQKIVPPSLFKIGKAFRYSMLPNNLIVPLMTMNHLKGCDDMIHYTMDRFFSVPIYCFCIFELVLVLGCTAVGYAKALGPRCMQSPPYMCYVCYRICTTPLVILVFVIDFFLVMDLRFWRGLVLGFKFLFSIEVSLTFTFTCNFVSILATTVALLDFWTLVIMILPMVAPVCASKIPIVGKYITDPKGNENADSNTP